MSLILSAGLTDAEMRAIELKIVRVRQARDAVTKAKHTLGLFNRYYEKEKQWTVELCLEKTGGYSSISVPFRVPMPMVQQQLIDEIKTRQRELILAEGDFAR